MKEQLIITGTPNSTTVEHALRRGIEAKQIAKEFGIPTIRVAVHDISGGASMEVSSGKSRDPREQERDLPDVRRVIPRS